MIDMGAVALDLDTGALLHAGENLCNCDALIIKKISEIYSPHVLDRLEMLRVAVDAVVLERNADEACDRV